MRLRDYISLLGRRPRERLPLRAELASKAAAVPVAIPFVDAFIHQPNAVNGATLVLSAVFAEHLAHNKISQYLEVRRARRMRPPTQFVD